MLIGSGFDLHRIQKSAKGGYLKAGGIRIPAPYHVVAHSDGDIILHALGDAICSALSIGDIGEKFPPGMAETKNMNSKHILTYALQETAKKKMRLSNVSIILAAERPKLSPYRKAIQESIAKILELNHQKIGLTFKTLEGVRPISNSAILCWAHCLMEKSRASLKKSGRQNRGNSVH